MKVVVMPAARDDLGEIWEHNAATYGEAHADRYVDFLVDETMTLGSGYGQGRSVREHPRFRYLTIRIGRGHGHLVVYQVVEDTVEVLRYFHTAQDWQGRL